MHDTYSAKTLYPTIIAPYDDSESESNESLGNNSSGSSNGSSDNAGKNKNNKKNNESSSYSEVDKACEHGKCTNNTSKSKILSLGSSTTSASSSATNRFGVKESKPFISFSLWTTVPITSPTN